MTGIEGQGEGQRYKDRNRRTEGTEGKGQEQETGRDFDRGTRVGTHFSCPLGEK